MNMMFIIIPLNASTKKIAIRRLFLTLDFGAAILYALFLPKMLVIPAYI